MKALATGLILSALLALPVKAQDEVYDTGVRPIGDECLKPGASEAVELAQLLKDPTAHKGRCVIVEGYVHAWALFLSKGDTKIKYAASAKVLDGRRLGLYGRDDLMEGLHGLPKGRYVRLTGKVWDCQSMRTSTTLFFMGYCHYTSGPTLSVVAYETAQPPR
ncbi:hypothetical protein [Asticcacaulis excentricus]|uniref:hypothetical protein n=1 Tax=Asticcacaulis excentricus TaxID=78587 RepID=UPI000F83F2E1|nr:hypothetical protein [Asticcacaulis excentricus]